LDSQLYNYTGKYSGVMDKFPTSLKIIQKGSDLQGELKKGKTNYNIVGVVVNDKIQGRISETESSETFLLEAENNNGILVMNLISMDLEEVISNSVSYSFKMLDTKIHEPIAPVNDFTNNHISFNDPQINGTWARDELLSNNMVTINAKIVIELNENGNYKILGAQKPEGHKDTGYSGDTTSGKWKTINNIFYILVSGSKHWKPYAKYEIVNNNLVFVLGDGERQVWNKIIN
jgi:hypothetical protein